MGNTLSFAHLRNDVKALLTRYGGWWEELGEVTFSTKKAAEAFIDGLYSLENEDALCTRSEPDFDYEDRFVVQLTSAAFQDEPSEDES